MEQTPTDPIALLVALGMMILQNGCGTRTLKEHNPSRVERASEVDISHAHSKAINTEVCGRDGKVLSDSSCELTKMLWFYSINYAFCTMYQKMA